MDKHCHVVVRRLTEHEILKETKSSKRGSRSFSSQTSSRKKSSKGASPHPASKKKGTKKSPECHNKSQQIPASRAKFLSNYKIPKLNLNQRSPVPETITSSDPSNLNIKSSHQNDEIKISSQNSHSSTSSIKISSQDSHSSTSSIKISSQDSHSSTSSIKISSQDSHSSTSSIKACILKERWKNKGISKRSKHEKKYRDMQLFVKQTKWTHIHDSTLPKSEQNCVRCLLKMIISSEELTCKDKTHRIKRILKKFSSEYPLKKSLVLDGIASKMKNKSATKIIPSIKFSKEFQSTNVDERIEKKPKLDNFERNFNSEKDTVKVTSLNKNESSDTVVQNVPKIKILKRKLKQNSLIKLNKEFLEAIRKRKYTKWSSGEESETECAMKDKDKLSESNKMKTQEMKVAVPESTKKPIKFKGNEKHTILLHELKSEREMKVSVPESPIKFKGNEKHTILSHELKSENEMKVFVPESIKIPILLKGNEKQAVLSHEFKSEKEMKVSVPESTEMPILFKENEKHTILSHGFKSENEMKISVPESTNMPILFKENEKHTILSHEIQSEPVSKNKFETSNENLKKDVKEKKIFDTTSVKKAVVSDTKHRNMLKIKKYRISSDDESDGCVKEYETEMSSENLNKQEQKVKVCDTQSAKRNMLCSKKNSEISTTSIKSSNESKIKFAAQIKTKGSYESLKMRKKGNEVYDTKSNKQSVISGKLEKPRSTPEDRKCRSNTSNNISNLKFVKSSERVKVTDTSKELKHKFQAQRNSNKLTLKQSNNSESINDKTVKEKMEDILKEVNYILKSALEKPNIKPTISSESRDPILNSQNSKEFAEEGKYQAEFCTNDFDKNSTCNDDEIPSEKSKVTEDEIKTSDNEKKNDVGKPSIQEKQQIITKEKNSIHKTDKIKFVSNKASSKYTKPDKNNNFIKEIQNRKHEINAWTKKSTKKTFSSSNCKLSTNSTANGKNKNSDTLLEKEDIKLQNNTASSKQAAPILDEISVSTLKTKPCKIILSKLHDSKTITGQDTMISGEKSAATVIKNSCQVTACKLHDSMAVCGQETLISDEKFAATLKTNSREIISKIHDKKALSGQETLISDEKFAATLKAKSREIISKIHDKKALSGQETLISGVKYAAALKTNSCKITESKLHDNKATCGRETLISKDKSAAALKTKSCKIILSKLHDSKTITGQDTMISGEKSAATVIKNSCQVTACKLHDSMAVCGQETLISDEKFAATLKTKSSEIISTIHDKKALSGQETLISGEKSAAALKTNSCKITTSKLNDNKVICGQETLISGEKSAAALKTNSCKITTSKLNDNKVICGQETLISGEKFAAALKTNSCKITTSKLNDKIICGQETLISGEKSAAALKTNSCKITTSKFHNNKAVCVQETLISDEKSMATLKTNPRKATVFNSKSAAHQVSLKKRGSGKTKSIKRKHEYIQFNCKSTKNTTPDHNVNQIKSLADKLDKEETPLNENENNLKIAKKRKTSRDFIVDSDDNIELKESNLQTETQEENIQILDLICESLNKSIQLQANEKVLDIANKDLICESLNKSIQLQANENVLDIANKDLICESLNKSVQLQANENVLDIANKTKSVDDSIVSESSNNQTELINNNYQPDYHKKLNHLLSECKSINNEIELSSISNTVNINAFANESCVTDLPFNETELEKNTVLVENLKSVKQDFISLESELVNKEFSLNGNESTSEITEIRVSLCSSTVSALPDHQAKVRENIYQSEVHMNLKPSSNSPACESVDKESSLNENGDSSDEVEIIDEKQQPVKNQVNKKLEPMSLESDSVQDVMFLSQNQNTFEAGKETEIGSKLCVLSSDSSGHSDSVQIGMTLTQNQNNFEAGKESIHEIGSKLCVLSSDSTGHSDSVQIGMTLTQNQNNSVAGKESITQIGSKLCVLSSDSSGHSDSVQIGMSLTQNQNSFEEGKEGITEISSKLCVLSSDSSGHSDSVQKGISLTQNQINFEAGKESISKMGSKLCVLSNDSSHHSDSAKKVMSFTQNQCNFEAEKESISEIDSKLCVLPSDSAQEGMSLTQNQCNFEAGKESLSEIGSKLCVLSSDVIGHSDCKKDKIQAGTEKDMQYNASSLEGKTISKSSQTKENEIESTEEMLSLKHNSGIKSVSLTQDQDDTETLCTIKDIKSINSKSSNKHRGNSQDLNHEIKRGTDIQKERNIISESIASKKVPLDYNKYDHLSLQDGNFDLIYDSKSTYCELSHPQTEVDETENLLKDIEDNGEIFKSLETESKCKSFKQKEIDDCVAIKKDMSKNSETPIKTSTKTQTEFSTENTKYKEQENDIFQPESSDKNVELTPDEDCLCNNTKSSNGESLSSKMLSQSECETTIALIKDNHKENHAENIKNKNYMTELTECELSCESFKLNLTEDIEITKKELLDSETISNTSMTNQCKIDTGSSCTEENELTKNNTLNQNKCIDKLSKERNLEFKSEEPTEEIKPCQTINYSENNKKKKHQSLSILRKKFAKEFSRYSSKKGYYHCKGLYPQTTKISKKAFKNNAQNNNNLMSNELTIQYGEEIVNDKHSEKNMAKSVSKEKTDELNFRQKMMSKIKSKMTSTAKKSTKEVKVCKYKCEVASSEIISDSSMSNSEVTHSSESLLKNYSSQADVDIVAEFANHTLPKLTEKISWIDEKEVKDFQEENMNVCEGKRVKELNSVIKFFRSKALSDCKNDEQDSHQTNSSSLFSNELSSQKENESCELFIPNVKVKDDVYSKEKSTPKTNNSSAQSEELDNYSQNKNHTNSMNYESSEAENRSRSIQHTRRKHSSSYIPTEEVRSQGIIEDNASDKDLHHNNNLHDDIYKATKERKICALVKDEDECFVSDNESQTGINEIAESKRSEKTEAKYQDIAFENEDDISNYNLQNEVSKSSALIQNTVTLCLHTPVEAAESVTADNLSIESLRLENEDKPFEDTELGCNELIQNGQNREAVTEEGNSDVITTILYEPMEVPATALQRNNQESAAEVENEMPTNSDYMAMLPFVAPGSEDSTQNLLQTDFHTEHRIIYLNTVQKSTFSTIPNHHLQVPLDINVGESIEISSENHESTDHHDNTDKSFPFPLDLTTNSYIAAIPVIIYNKISDNVAEVCHNLLPISDPSLSSDFHSTDDPSVNMTFVNETEEQLAISLLNSATEEKFDVDKSCLEITNEKKKFQYEEILYSDSSNDSTNEASHNYKILKTCADKSTAERQDDSKLDHTEKVPEASFSSQESEIVSNNEKVTKDLNFQMQNLFIRKDNNNIESSSNNGNEIDEADTDIASSVLNLKNPGELKPKLNCEEEKSIEMKDFLEKDNLHASIECSVKLVVNDSNSAEKDSEVLKDNEKCNNLNGIVNKKESFLTDMTMSAEKEANITTDVKELLEIPAQAIDKNLSADSTFDMKNKHQEKCEVIDLTLSDEEDISTQDTISRDEVSQNEIDGTEQTADSTSDLPSAFCENKDTSFEASSASTHVNQKIFSGENLKDTEDTRKLGTSKYEAFQKLIDSIIERSSDDLTVYDRQRLVIDIVTQLCLSDINQDSNKNKSDWTTDTKSTGKLKSDCNGNDTENCNLVQLSEVEHFRKLFGSFENASGVISEYISNTKISTETNAEKESKKSFLSSPPYSDSSNSKNAMIVSEGNTVACSPALTSLMISETRGTPSLSPPGSMVSEASATSFQLTSASLVDSKSVLTLSPPASISAFDMKTDKNCQEQPESFLKTVLLADDVLHSRPPIILTPSSEEDCHISNGSLHTSSDRREKSSAKSKNQKPKPKSSHSSTKNKKAGCDTINYSVNAQNHSSPVHVHHTSSETQANILLNNSAMSSASTSISHAQNFNYNSAIQNLSYNNKHHQQFGKAVNLNDPSPKHSLSQENQSSNVQLQNNLTKQSNSIYPNSAPLNLSQALDLSLASTESMTSPLQSLYRITTGQNSTNNYLANSSNARASNSHREDSSQVIPNIFLPSQPDLITRGATAQPTFLDNLSTRNESAERTVPPDSSSHSYAIPKRSCTPNSSATNVPISQISNTNADEHLFESGEETHALPGYISNDQEVYQQNSQLNHAYLRNAQKYFSALNHQGLDHRNSAVSCGLPILKTSMPIWTRPENAMLTPSQNFHVQNTAPQFHTNQFHPSVPVDMHQFQVPYSHSQHPCVTGSDNQFIINPENVHPSNSYELQHRAALMQELIQNYYASQHLNPASQATVNPNNPIIVGNYGRRISTGDTSSSERSSASSDSSFNVNCDTFQHQATSNLSNSSEFIPVAVPPNFPPQLPVSAHTAPYSSDVGIPQNVPDSSLSSANAFLRMPFPYWYNAPHMPENSTQFSTQELLQKGPLCPPCFSCGNPASILCIHCKEVYFCGDKCVTDRRFKGAKHLRTCMEKHRHPV